MANVFTAFFGNLALLPMQAQAPATESLEWLTDMMTSKNGTESPLSVRGNARQSLTFTTPEWYDLKPMILNTEYGGLRRQWAVPLWTETQQLGPINAGGTTITCLTDDYDFRNESLALLWESPTNWQIIEIINVNSGSLQIYKPVHKFTKPLLMPVRRGYVNGNISKRVTGFDSESSISYDIEDNLDVSQLIPDQFLGYDIYFDSAQMDGESQDLKINSRVDVVDYDLGLRARRAPWRYNRNTRTQRFLAEGPTEVRALRRFLARRRGRERRFWQPSFENDLRLLSTGTINTTVLTYEDGYFDWSTRRTHLAFLLDDGTWQARTLSAASSIGSGKMQFTINSALGVDAKRVRCISWLGLKRFDTDRVEIDWLGNYVMATTINITELQP